MTAESRSPLDVFHAQIRAIVGDDSKWPSDTAAQQLRDELRAMLDDPGLTDASLSHYAQAVAVATAAMHRGLMLAPGALAELVEGSSWIDEVWSRHPTLTPEQLVALFSPPQGDKPA